jgi:hypothetical protein
MHDGVMRERERRLRRESIEAPLVDAGFTPTGRRFTWLRHCGDVVHLVGCYDASRDRGPSVEWGAWLGRLAKLFGERDPQPPADLRRSHLRGGDHRLPRLLKSDSAVESAAASARAATHSYLAILDGLRTAAQLRGFLLHDGQRLWPPSHLTPITIAGLSVLEDDPHAVDLAERALRGLTADDPWHRIAEQVSQVARSLSDAGRGASRD